MLTPVIKRVHKDTTRVGASSTVMTHLPANLRHPRGTPHEPERGTIFTLGGLHVHRPTIELRGRRSK